MHAGAWVQTVSSCAVNPDSGVTGGVYEVEYAAEKVRPSYSYTEAHSQVRSQVTRTDHRHSGRAVG